MLKLYQSYSKRSLLIAQPAGKMVAAAKAAVPTVGEQAAALQLGNFAKSTAIALAELRSASARAAEVCGSLEIDSAIARVKELSKEIVAYKQEAASGKLASKV